MFKNLIQMSARVGVPGALRLGTPTRALRERPAPVFVELNLDRPRATDIASGPSL